MEPDLSDPRGGDPDFEQRRVQALLISRMFEREEPGCKIGRFTILDRVGRGGMGDVYAAYDPELDRKVAVKLLRSDIADESVRKRIVREAQAMAKLSHPNVAQVFEVGEHQGGTFIAMEFVRGSTLREWQEEEGRPWRDVLEMYVQAGRGLAAAHAAGLVHRDFKPDNAIVGRDGRVRVLDFGLARAGEIETTKEMERDTVLPAPHDDALATPLTGAGALMGTPAYMAPEQFLGEDVTAKTDQFALCVSLWEGLYGERPFAGSTRADLIADVTRGRVREVPKQSSVPAWVRAVLLRGLAVGPADRFASTDALLGALQNDPSIRRRRVMVGGGRALAIGVVIAGAVGWWRYDAARQIAACEAAGAGIAEVWNDSVREQVRASLVATDVVYAETTADKLMPWLDAQASAWRDERTQACVRHEVHGTWDADVHDRALWCLDERRMELEAFVGELTRADAEVVQQAVPAAAALSRVPPCSDTALLVRLPAPPSGKREQIRAVRAQLSRVRALESAGKYVDALVAARAARGDAEALEWPPLLAEAELSLGHMLDVNREHADALRTLEDAYYRAERSGATEVAAAASSHLIRLADDGADGIRWSRQAEVALSTLGDDGDGLLSTTRLNNLAHVLSNRGEDAEAIALNERVLDIVEGALGPEHPLVAFSLNKLALVLHDDQSYGRAKALHERALAIREAALGADHPLVAGSLNNLGNTMVAFGAWADAKALYGRALVIHERALGPEHPLVAGQLSNLGGVAYKQRALALYEKAFGPEDAHVVHALLELADVLQATGEHADAKALYERALAHYEKSIGTEHPFAASCMMGLAKVALATNHPSDALALAERAVAIMAKFSWRRGIEHESRFVLARALWDAGRDRAHALALARGVRDAWREDGEVRKRKLSEVEQWLREHDANE